jgi:hypothetical protein
MLEEVIMGKVIQITEWKAQHPEYRSCRDGVLLLKTYTDMWMTIWGVWLPWMR